MKVLSAVGFLLLPLLLAGCGGSPSPKAEVPKPSDKPADKPSAFKPVPVDPKAEMALMEKKRDLYLRLRSAWDNTAEKEALQKQLDALDGIETSSSFDLAGLLPDVKDRNVSTSNLRQLAIALFLYHDQQGCFPAGTHYDRTIRKLSWRVDLLPLIEGDAVYAGMQHNETWDHPSNKQALTQMLKVYYNPRYPPELQKKGMTYYRAITGSRSVLGNPQGVTMSVIANGTGLRNTILIVEAADPVPWTKPDELVIEADKPLPKLGPNGKDFLALFADGSVRLIPTDTDEKTLRQCFTFSNPASVAPVTPERKIMDTSRTGTSRQ